MMISNKACLFGLGLLLLLGTTLAQQQVNCAAEDVKLQTCIEENECTCEPFTARSATSSLAMQNVDQNDKVAVARQTLLGFTAICDHIKTNICRLKFCCSACQEHSQNLNGCFIDKQNFDDELQEIQMEMKDDGYSINNMPELDFECSLRTVRCNADGNLRDDTTSYLAQAGSNGISNSLHWLVAAAALFPGIM